MQLNFLLTELVKYIQKIETNLDDSHKSKIDNVTHITGLLSTLLGKKMKYSKMLINLGSAVTLGTIAYQVYQKYKAENTTYYKNQKVESISTLSDKESTKIILRTMIAAAAADGEISEQDRKLITNQNKNNHTDLTNWLNEEFEQPASIKEITENIGHHKTLAAEAYLAARVICSDLSHSQTIFLSDLSKSLNLDERFIKILEEYAGF